MNKTQRKILALLVTVFTLTVLILIFRQEVSAFLNKSGVFGLLRAAKLIKPDSSDFFEAMETQNLIYDYNSDGVVDGADYSLLTDSAEETTVTAESLDMAVAESTDATTANPAAAGKLALPSLSGFSTDSFSGSVTAGYGFDLPPGPAGMIPPLGLAYSSGSVDDMYTGTETKWRNDPDHPYQQQAGIFGLGWDLSGLGTITRDISGTLNDPTDDGFILAYAGGSARLAKETLDDSETYSVWRTIPNIEAKVERFGICKTYNTKSICRYHWQVTAPDGTKYIFGVPPVSAWQRNFDPDTTYGFTGDWYPLYEQDTSGLYLTGNTPWQVYGSDDNNLHALNYQWPLTKVLSVYHLTGVREVLIGYRYAFEFGDYKGKKYVRAVYPDRIDYGSNRIQFVTEDRLDYQVHVQTKDLTVAEQPMFATKRISKINVTTLGKPRINYDLEYKYGWEPAKHLDANGNGLPDGLNEIKGGQVIHSLLNKVTPWTWE